MQKGVLSAKFILMTTLLMAVLAQTLMVGISGGGVVVEAKEPTIRQSPLEVVPPCEGDEYATITYQGIVCAKTTETWTNECDTPADCCNSGTFLKITPTGLQCFPFSNKTSTFAQGCDDCCGAGEFAVLTTLGLRCVGGPCKTDADCADPTPFCNTEIGRCEHCTWGDYTCRDTTKRVRHCKVDATIKKTQLLSCAVNQQCSGGACITGSCTITKQPGWTHGIPSRTPCGTTVTSSCALGEDSCGNKVSCTGQRRVIVGEKCPVGETCTNGACISTAVDGGWSDWDACVCTANTADSETAGIQYRTCDNPTPSGGGANCNGQAQQACTTSGCSQSCTITKQPGWTHGIPSRTPCGTTVTSSCALGEDSCGNKVSCTGQRRVIVGEKCPVGETCTNGTCSPSCTTPVDGGWSTLPTAANVTCGTTQTATCTNPTPSCGGGGCGSNAPSVTGTKCSSGKTCQNGQCIAQPTCTYQVQQASWSALPPAASVDCGITRKAICTTGQDKCGNTVQCSSTAPTVTGIQCLTGTCRNGTCEQAPTCNEPEYAAAWSNLPSASTLCSGTTQTATCNYGQDTCGNTVDCIGSARTVTGTKDCSASPPPPASYVSSPSSYPPASYSSPPASYVNPPPPPASYVVNPPPPPAVYSPPPKKCTTWSSLPSASTITCGYTQTATCAQGCDCTGSAPTVTGIKCASGTCRNGTCETSPGPVNDPCKGCDPTYSNPSGSNIACGQTATASCNRSGCKRACTKTCSGTATTVEGEKCPDGYKCDSVSRTCKKKTTTDDSCPGTNQCNCNKLTAFCNADNSGIKRCYCGWNADKTQCEKKYDGSSCATGETCSGGACAGEGTVACSTATNDCACDTTDPYCTDGVQSVSECSCTLSGDKCVQAVKKTSCGTKSCSYGKCEQWGWFQCLHRHNPDSNAAKHGHPAVFGNCLNSLNHKTHDQNCTPKSPTWSCPSANAVSCGTSLSAICTKGQNNKCGQLACQSFDKPDCSGTGTKCSKGVCENNKCTSGKKTYLYIAPSWSCPSNADSSHCGQVLTTVCNKGQKKDGTSIDCPSGSKPRCFGSYCSGGRACENGSCKGDSNICTYQKAKWSSCPSASSTLCGQTIAPTCRTGVKKDCATIHCSANTKPSCSGTGTYCSSGTCNNGSCSGGGNGGVSCSGNQCGCKSQSPWCDSGNVKQCSCTVRSGSCVKTWSTTTCSNGCSSGSCKAGSTPASYSPSSYSPSSYSPSSYSPSSYSPSSYSSVSCSGNQCGCKSQSPWCDSGNVKQCSCTVRSGSCVKTWSTTTCSNGCSSGSCKAGSTPASYSPSSYSPSSYSPASYGPSCSGNQCGCKSQSPWCDSGNVKQCSCTVRSGSCVKTWSTTTCSNGCSSGSCKAGSTPASYSPSSYSPSSYSPSSYSPSSYSPSSYSPSSYSPSSYRRSRTPSSYSPASYSPASYSPSSYSPSSYSPSSYRRSRTPSSYSPSSYSSVSCSGNQCGCKSQSPWCSGGGTKRCYCTVRSGSCVKAWSSSSCANGCSSGSCN